MKWRTRQEGDQRTRTLFALIPRETDDGETVWLERVQVVERYSRFWDRWAWQEVSCVLASGVHEVLP